ncbi:hypothetical protein D6T65_12345 [Arthrobacter frigidicola]|nr:hypothetical protein D6T65_12345 [Arthrobacter frigidicola]
MTAPPARIKAPGARTVPVAAVLLLGAAVALSGCGRLAEQIDAAESPLPTAPAAGPLATAPVQAPPPAPATTAPVPSAAPTPAPPPTKAPELSLTHSQQSLPAEVVKACGALLTGTLPERLPAAEAGACVEASMRAGIGALQTLSTRATGLPAGEHIAAVSTAPEFGLHLRNEEHGVEIIVSGGEGYLLTPKGGTPADAKGGPEERFAAVLVQAASATADPAAVGALLKDSGEFLVTPRSERDGMLYTRLSAVSGPELQGVKMATLDIELDELMRPAHLSISGFEHEILTSVEVGFSDWGTPQAITPPALAQLGGLR